MKESGLVHEACVWCYRGVWGTLTKYFCLPDGPPILPILEGEVITYFRPSLAYLRYRKFFFWIGLAVVDIVLSLLWLGLIIAAPLWGFITAPLWLFVIVVPDILAYIAIHLRYDTTWYVLSDRSMRIRRGIWSIYETTITFENIQNVSISQGPLQRWFGFANLVVSTAGGGGGAEAGASSWHVGLLEGIEDAELLRERILSKSHRNAGLGDEEPQATYRRIAPMSFSENQIVLLREIQSLTAQLAKPHATERSF
jgi:uncharacterized membrane protein YdbT with pleckstrin-like domain